MRNIVLRKCNGSSEDHLRVEVRLGLELERRLLPARRRRGRGRRRGNLFGMKYPVVLPVEGHVVHQRLEMLQTLVRSGLSGRDRGSCTRYRSRGGDSGHAFPRALLGAAFPLSLCALPWLEQVRCGNVVEEAEVGQSLRPLLVEPAEAVLKEAVP